MPKPYYKLVDLTALRQLLTERAEDWKPCSLNTIIQAAVYVASDHIEEWYLRANAIDARKLTIRQANARHAGKVKLQKK